MYEKPEYKVLEENMKIPAYKKVSFNEEKFEFKYDDLAPEDMETKKKGRQLSKSGILIIQFQYSKEL